MRGIVRRAVVIGALVAVIGGFAAGRAAPLPDCGTPELSVPEFVAGDSNTVEWTQPAGPSEGGGFILEVASTPVRDTDSSLLDVEQTIGDIDAAARSYTVSGLSEGTHWYSIKAKTKSQTCASSPWSAAEVSTVQDSTAPVVTIDEPESGHIYLLESVTVSGTLTDTGSGPDSVTVSITNTTPVAGEILGAPDSITVDASTGAWTATFTGVLPGTYTISAVGTDLVGNVSEAATLDVIVTVTA